MISWKYVSTASNGLPSIKIWNVRYAVVILPGMAIRLFPSSSSGVIGEVATIIGPYISPTLEPCARIAYLS